MPTFDKETAPSEENTDKSSSITSSGTILDPSLSQLREQIKNAMIPLLIRVFHLRLEVQQASSPPSRLSKSSKTPLDELVAQLQKLDEDLKLLQIWSQSCRNQILKVLQEAEEELSPSLPNQFHAKTESHPGVQRSFHDAIISQQEKSKEIKPLQNQVPLTDLPKEEITEAALNSWWQKIRSKLF